MTNQAWQITSPGVLALKDAGPIPKPGPKEALVRIQAASFNYRDKLIVEHDPNYPVKHKANLVPCSDGAGIVEVSGPDSVWKKGDRVVVQPNQWSFGNDDRDYELDKTLGGGDLDGTLQRWMVVSDERILRAPEAMSVEEACTLYTAGVTAYRALFHGGKKVQPGMTVLTQGTGGVSCYGIMVRSSVDHSRAC